MKKFRPEELREGDMWWDDKFPLVLLGKEKSIDPFFKQLVLWKLTWAGRGKNMLSTGVFEDFYTEDSRFKIIARKDDV